MVGKRLLFGLVVMAVVLCVVLTSCVTSTGRETIPKTAVTLQRIRSNVDEDLPMQIFLDDVPYEFANGSPSQTITVNNGEHLVYAIIGGQETKSVRFTAKSQSIVVNAGYRSRLLGLAAELVIEVD
jgi:hypothetical protein